MDWMRPPNPKVPMRAFVLAILASCVASIASAATLTDIAVFSANDVGNNWNGLIWNTQGADTDVPDRFNLYVSTDPLSDTSPQFLNGRNDAATRVAIPLASGSNTFSFYGEGVDTTFDPLQHFVLNLYFGAVQTLPAISGLQNLANDDLQPAGHPNGLDIYGNSGTQEAGTLSAHVGQQLITLTAFSWITDGNRDVVWPYWANDPPYSVGSGHLDYYGSFTLSVQQVPLAPTWALLLAGLAAMIGASGRSASRRASGAYASQGVLASAR